MTTGIVITTRNEGQTIHGLVRTFTRYGWNVYVVDDDSGDETATLAALGGAKVVVNARRQGIGPCLMQAWRMAREDGHACVLQIDAGDSHQARDCLAIFNAAAASEADMVIGSRFLPGSKYDNWNGSWYRPMLSRLAALAMNYAQWGAKYTDWTSGYRYFNDKALDLLLRKNYIAKMHGWQIETLAYAGEAGLKIIEVPISYKAGRSSFNKTVAWEAIMTFLHVMHHVMYVGAGKDV